MRAVFNDYLKRGFLWIIAVLLPLSPLHGADSISYYGVTLHFSVDCIVGKFADGEPWIVGPVSVTGIDKPSIPLDSKFTGGAMINPIPGGLQGFCPRNSDPTLVHRYDASLDVSLKYPFTLAAGDSLIVARTTEPPNDTANMIESIVGFTVLASAPPEGSFRPGLYGKDRRIRFNVSDIDWSILKNLPRVAATPTQAWIEADARLPALPWWDWAGEWGVTRLRPFANCGAGDGGGFRSNYGREIAFKWSYVALWLNCDFPQAVKQKTMVQTIQAGIDLGSYFDNGGVIGASGGHQVGFKFPMFLAAAALKDSGLVTYASAQNRFIEDVTTFYVLPTDVGRVVESGTSAAYLQEDVGIADWGILHAWNPAKDDRRWRDGVPYRFAQWPAMTGQVFAAELMGLKEAWGHPAIFAYNERFVSKEGLGNGFEGQMWDRYKLGRPTAPQGLKKKR